MSADEPQPGAKLRFLFFNGILGWGVPFFVLMLIWDYVEQGGMPPAKNVIQLAFISAFGGLVLGLWLWKDRAKKA